MPWPFRKRATPAVTTAATPRPRRPSPPAVTGPSCRRCGRRSPPLAPTSAAQQFTASLASRQPIVRRPVMTHVRGVPSTGAAPDAFAPASRRSPTATPIGAGTPAGDDTRTRPAADDVGARPGSAIDHLLAVPWAPDTNGTTHDALPSAERGHDERRRAGPEPVAPDPSVAAARPSAAPGIAPDEPAGTAGGRRSLAGSRRVGLGPAYHDPLPDAMRAEHRRAGATNEPVPPDVSAAVRQARSGSTSATRWCTAVPT